MSAKFSAHSSLFRIALVAALLLVAAGASMTFYQGTIISSSGSNSGGLSGGSEGPQPATVKAPLISSAIEAYSPDGQYLVFAEPQKGTAAHLYLKNLVTKQQWRLTEEAKPFVGLAFTADGQALTYLSREADSDVVATFDINLQKGLSSVHYNQLSFERAQILGRPIWLDNDKLAYVSRLDNQSVQLMQWSSSQGRHQLITLYSNNRKPAQLAVSPDQQTIAVAVTGQTESQDIELIKLADNSTSLLANFEGSVDSLSWEKGSDHLLVSSNNQRFRIALNGEREALPQG